MAAVYLGTSGFSYKEWKGSFYPEGVSEKGFLAHYATRLNAVEIDATFYRIPSPQAVEAWRAATPAGFRFAIKAPQKVTHRERLESPSETNAFFLKVLEPLGDKLGMVLYQLPPFFRASHERLARFLEALPAGARTAFEFRHASWFTPETYELLRSRGAALCIHDQDDSDAPLELTAPRVYVRLRRTSYDSVARDAWKARLRGFADGGTETFAFIKHKDNPRAPFIALEFADGLAPPPA